ncbi:MAG TPA: phytoene/squalene synthase family protein [Polyangiales bacterium]|nr:phytoene/squalene synthase family protein [Polyangiales bacterium]
MNEAGREALRECRRILEHNSKSFALASKLLPASARDEAAAVYAFCRRVDDAIDDAPPESQAGALSALYEDLDRVYRGDVLTEPALAAFQAVVQQRQIPRRYPAELIEGMAMDVRNTQYQTLDNLLLYCHCVAGVVGLMMCHVFGLSADGALHNAAHLGIAMQLTNICRDVEEDWRLGRVYLPSELLRAAGAGELGQPGVDAFPTEEGTLLAIRRVTEQLLHEADRYYASADRGIHALPFRAGLAVRAARRLYHAIGLEVAAQGDAPRRRPAVVPTPRKLKLLGKAVVRHVGALPRTTASRVQKRQTVSTPRRELSFPEDVLV